MKKTLLLSVVASTMIMAGGDIAPVQPVVAAPAAAAAWNFSGQAVAYYQTQDLAGAADLFDKETSVGNTGVQLGATNSDVVAGIGAGVEVTGLAELPWIADNYAQTPTADESKSGGWISQAYLTYGFGNTSIKVGRQELPKSLSPFAFSESWNVFKNSFDAALLVNTDIANTALVYAFIDGANFNAPFGLTAMNHFEDVNGDDGIHMLTAQNKSFEGVTLTGSWYYATDLSTLGDTNILWGDAAFAVSSFNIALQGGTIMTDAALTDDTTAFGAEIGRGFGSFGVSLAYSTVNDGTTPVINIGGTDSALYTDMIGDELTPARIDNDKFVVRADADLLGGNIAAAYGYTDFGIDAEINEFDVAYSANITDNASMQAAYANIDYDLAGISETTDTIRIWGRYNF